MKASLVMYSVAVLTPVAGVEPVGLVEDGRANVTIVVSDQADSLVRRTATDLQDVLRKMSDVVVPIRTDDVQISGNRLLVGQTRWTDGVVSPAERASLSKEGFILRVKDTNIALVGGGPYGVAYAASELLERLGVRWYLPGPLGEVIPKQKAVRLGSVDVRQEPSFPMRWVGKDLAWNLRNRTNGIKDPSLPPAYRIVPGIYHTQARLIPHAMYDKTHPEFFALSENKRSRENDCKLCNSNPQLPAEIAGRMGDILRENPGTDLISLSPTDGQLWCECPDCGRLDEQDVPRDQKYSRRQMILYNRVAAKLAEKFPEQLMLVGAYNVYTWPPRDPQIKAHPNLAVVICHYEDYCLAHPVNDPQCKRNRRYSELIDAWRKHTKHICFYEYYDKVNWLDLPWPIVHTVAADIPHFKGLGLEGLYTQYTEANIWSNFLVHYVAAKLLWDPTTDVEALLEEFYVKFYGRAAEPMKKYHEALEEKVATSRIHFPGNAPRYATTVFTPELLAKLDNHLEQAGRLAEDDLVKARIERISLSIDYAKRLVGVFRLRDEAKAAREDRCHALLRKALEKALDLRQDVLTHRDKYAGVVTGRYFSGRMMFARQIDKLAKAVKAAEK